MESSLEQWLSNLVKGLLSFRLSTLSALEHSFSVVYEKAVAGPGITLLFVSGRAVQENINFHRRFKQKRGVSTGSLVLVGLLGRWSGRAEVCRGHCCFRVCNPLLGLGSSRNHRKTLPTIALLSINAGDAEENDQKPLQKSLLC